MTIGTNKRKDELPYMVRIWGQMFSFGEFLELQLTALEWCLILKCGISMVFVTCWPDASSNYKQNLEFGLGSGCYL